MESIIVEDSGKYQKRLNEFSLLENIYIEVQQVRCQDQWAKLDKLS